ncbi:hypothetical protein ACL58G_29465 [Massilia sp. GER05]|uniref:hypothetical protein n=1 Tax=Massilia sp. GER05 TaxID=3394605 RepID=UPI003F87DD6A
MDMLAYRSVAAAAAVFHMRYLELAPEGWRTCVERVAHGLCDQDGEKAFCLLCGGELQGVAGHDISCLTMVARRILANEPLLLERYKAQMALHYVALDDTVGSSVSVGLQTVEHQSRPLADINPNAD